MHGFPMVKSPSIAHRHLGVMESWRNALSGRLHTAVGSRVVA